MFEFQGFYFLLAEKGKNADIAFRIFVTAIEPELVKRVRRSLFRIEPDIAFFGFAGLATEVALAGALADDAGKVGAFGAVGAAGAAGAGASAANAELAAKTAATSRAISFIFYSLSALKREGEVRQVL